jgi:hypothetical protein
LLLDTSTFVNDVHVVGENSVTRVLRDDTKGDNDSKTPHVTPGLEEVNVASRLGSAVGLDCLLDLAVLELNCGVVLVTTGMVLGQDTESLLRSVLVDKETRRLRNPPDTAKLDDGRDGLDEGDGSP